MMRKLIIKLTILTMVLTVFGACFVRTLNIHARMMEVANSKNEIAFNELTIPTYKESKTQRVIEYQEGKSFGIDVSAWQHNINWSKVKQSGVDFAMIRVGFRGYKGGDIHIDEKFHNNIEGAIKNNIKVGIYFYSAARNQAEAIKEAQFVIDKIRPYKNYITYPVAFDLENINSDRLEGISGKQLTKNAVAFMEHIKSNGYTPMFYGGRIHMSTTWDMQELNKYLVWLAHYTDKTDYKNKYDMWQYTSSGKVPGISGNVDMNVAYYQVLVRYSDEENEKVIKDTPFTSVNDTVVVKTYANFRKSPTMELDNKITDSIAPNTKLQRVGISEDGLWSKVIYNDTTGYVFNNYLKM